MSEIDELRKLASEASQFPWEQGEGDNDIRVYCDDPLGTCVAECAAPMNSMPRPQRVKNMAFITAMANALPAILDRLEAAEASSGWQPIGTADKNAKKLELGISRNGVIEEIHVGGYRFAWNEDEVSCWWSDQCDDEIVPTHWRHYTALPLPSPPTNPF